MNASSGAMNRAVDYLIRADSLGAWVVKGALLIPVGAYFADILPAWPTQGKLVIAAATIILQMAVIATASPRTPGERPILRSTAPAIALSAFCLIAYLVLFTMFTLNTQIGRLVIGYAYASQDAVLMQQRFGSDLEALRASGYDLERLYSTGSLAVTRMSLLVTWIGLMAGSAYLIAVQVPHRGTALARIDRRVFINYRRSDSETDVGRIYDRLVARMGKDNVFKDVDSIRPGENFARSLQEALDHTDVVLAVIGPEWETITDDQGARRIELESDFVQIEIRNAFEQKIPLIPLLVRRAKMPSDESYPVSIGDLKYSNNILVRPDPDFERDVDRILDAVASYPRRKSS